MPKDKNTRLFNTIAPIYALFYNYQKRKYSIVIEKIKNEIDIASSKNIIDFGCGTGALCSALNDLGLEVVGIDPAIKMITKAKSIEDNKGIKFVLADALKKLPFNNSSFDIAIASYVAHGIKADERKRIYLEMSRITRNYVIIHDYNSEKSLVTSIIEWLEGGDYFRFILNAEEEMQKYFKEVRVIDVDKRASWYICKPY